AFAPELVPAAFPGLTNLEQIDERLARDIDVAGLAAACGVTFSALSGAPDGEPRGDGQPLTPPAAPAPEAVSQPRLALALRQRWLLGAARRAAHGGHQARCAVLAARVVGSANAELAEQAEQSLQGSMQHLSTGLALASQHEDGPSVDDWS